MTLVDVLTDEVVETHDCELLEVIPAAPRSHAALRRMLLSVCGGRADLVTSPGHCTAIA